MPQLNIKCTRCNEVLTSKVKWLELSNTDGNYYDPIPKNHVSQGIFPFGITCATAEIKQTTIALQELIKLNGN